MPAPQPDPSFAAAIAPRTPAASQTAPAPIGRDVSAYAAAALAGEVDNLSAVPIGSGRNDQLNRSAFKLGQLVAAGALDERTVTEQLGAADGGLDHKATRDTIASGLAAGTAHARAIPDRPLPVAPAAVDPFGEVTPVGAAPTHTSWFPVDITSIIAGHDTASAVPVFLARQDGHRLFYAAKINGLIGESESGKTWVALHTVQRSLAEGERVLFLDFEDTPQTIIGRLRALGSTDEHLTRFAYTRPDEPLRAAQTLADLDASLAGHRPALVILDGLNEAMTMLGLEPLSNSDVTRFAQDLLRRITATGAGLITIDHTGKTAGGKGALGAQAKRAIVDGCTLRVEAVKPFGRGQSGQLRLGIDKDRPGHVRGNSVRGDAGTVVLAAQDADGLILVTVEAPGVMSTAGQGFRPTHYMQKISERLEAEESPQTSNAIMSAGGAKAVLRTALGVLVAEGFVAATPGANRATLHRSVTPYRQTDDSQSDLYVSRDVAA